MARQFVLGFLLLFLSMPAAATWRVAETAHFRVFGDMPEDRLRSRAALLEDFRALLDTMTTARLADGLPRLDIYIVDKLAATMPFDTIQPNIAGYYLAGSRGISAFAVADDAGQQTLLHEYAHHHMFAATGRSYPAWYVEGFAEYFSTARFQPAHVDFGHAPPNIGRLLMMKGIPWTIELSGRPDGNMPPMVASVFYARSWLLAHYLFRQDGQREKLQAYLKAVGEGEKSEAAFARLIADPKTLDGVLHAYLGSRQFTFSRLTRQPMPPAAITVRTLPPSADALLMMFASLDTRGPAAFDQSAALVKVRAAAERFAGDALATRTLALAEIYWGDKARALALVDGALAASPDDPALLRLKAQALLAIDAKANRGAARRALVQAVNKDPQDWRAMRLFVDTHDLVGSLLPGSLHEVITEMWSLAPQVRANAMAMAVSLIRRDRLADAATVLQPLAFSPHGAPEAVIDLHAAAKAGDRPAIDRLLASGRVE